MAFLTDLETLAQQIRPAYGGISFVLWRDTPPIVLLRAKGGMSFDHIPIKEAFESNLVRCDAKQQMATEQLLSSIKVTDQDIVMDGKSISGTDVLKPAIGDECFLLQIQAIVNNNWESVGSRLLVPRDTTVSQFVRLYREKQVISAHLLQGPRPQHCAKCEIKVPKEVLDVLDPKPLKGLWQFWK